MILLGEAERKNDRAPLFFYHVAETYLFPPGVNVRWVTDTRARYVQNGKQWLPIVAPKTIVTAADATCSLIDEAEFTAAYDVTRTQDNPRVPVTPVEQEPVGDGEIGAQVTP